MLTNKCKLKWSKGHWVIMKCSLRRYIINIGKRFAC